MISYNSDIYKYSTSFLSLLKALKIKKIGLRIKTEIEIQIKLHYENNFPLPNWNYSPNILIMIYYNTTYFHSKAIQLLKLKRPVLFKFSARNKSNAKRLKLFIFLHHPRTIYKIHHGKKLSIKFHGRENNGIITMPIS